MSPHGGLVRPLLCLVTDRLRVGHPPPSKGLLEVVSAAARGGLQLVQIRERDLEAAPLCRLVEECREAVSGTGAQVVVNDRIDVALAGGAHGVHLREDSAPTVRVRSLVPRPLLIGRSVHSVEAVERESRTGALDYLILGPVFHTRSKPVSGDPLGLDVLHEAVGVSSVPVLAIGGVTLDNIPRLAETGAAGFAAISLFLDADNPEEVARRAREAFVVRD